MSSKIIGTENGSHINEGGWSPEAINRAKNIQFFLYDTKIKRTIPITGEITVLDKGDKVNLK